MVNQNSLTRPSDLPQWSSPPLDEVAIAVQFKSIRDWQILHYGLLAEEFRRIGLPGTEDHSTIRESFEVFGKLPPKLISSPPVIQHVEVPMPRVWYMSEDRHRLAQVQPDRFVYNWRKVEGAGTYPRLNTVLPEFWTTYKVFREFLRGHDLPQPEINQCELSYFNSIPVLEGTGYAENFSRIFKPWANQDLSGAATSLNDMLEPEVANFRSTSVLRASEGEPLGRVHVQAASAVMNEKKAIRLSIVFRAPWTGDNDCALSEFFGRGREAIVRVFDSLITEKMHEAWGRRISKDLEK